MYVLIAEEERNSTKGGRSGARLYRKRSVVEGSERKGGRKEIVGENAVWTPCAT